MGKDSTLGMWPDLPLSSAVVPVSISLRLQDLSLHLKRFLGQSLCSE